MRHPLLSLLAAVLFLSSCIDNKTNSATETSGSSDSTATVDGHPAWIIQGNVYEVNVRQYTPQGTFKAFEASLQRLKDMGVQTLWFMPINPISKTDRKGALG
ncbi:MAG TPA: 1,4-alpha-glucan branching protein, partial [Flavisolibacter sp.]|nr:1,4-alpha-glucan branching protein [Flavisolibacter sp.]